MVDFYGLLRGGLLLSCAFKGSLLRVGLFRVGL